METCKRNIDTIISVCKSVCQTFKMQKYSKSDELCNAECLTTDTIWELVCNSVHPKYVKHVFQNGKQLVKNLDPKKHIVVFDIANAFANALKRMIQPN